MCSFHHPDFCLLLPSQDLLSIVASVLHLGNVQFAADEQGNAQVTTENQIKYLARVSITSEGDITAKVNCRGFLTLSLISSYNFRL